MCVHICICMDMDIDREIPSTTNSCSSRGPKAPGVVQVDPSQRPYQHHISGPPGPLSSI